MRYSYPTTLQHWHLSRQTIIGIILAVALFSFEIFNYGTTEFALASLLTGANFAGITWAAILAFAFCAIDFAGLAHLFTPQNLHEENKETYYLMGAWLLGATMNALMTWWAVTLLLIDHPLVGNEVLNHAQLLNIVPIFVAVLVWLTRILFIGALSVAGEQLFQPTHAPQQKVTPPIRQTPHTLPKTEAQQRRSRLPRRRRSQMDMGMEIAGISAHPHHPNG